MTLLELAEACERAESGSRELDAAIDSAIFQVANSTFDVALTPPHYTSLVDAAMQLVPKGLGFMIDGYGTGWYADCSADIDAQAHAKTPALALCAAALRARHAMEVE